MNLQDELKALKERIAELERKVEQEQKFPQDGDKYWSVSMNGRVLGSEWDGYTSEEGRLEIGNVFKTKEQAEFALEKLKVEAELRKFSRSVFKEDEDNSFIQINASHHNLVVDTDEGYQTQGTIYFKNRFEAHDAIQTVGEDRIKKYIFGVED